MQAAFAFAPGSPDRAPCVFAAAHRLYGLPRDYLAIDTETTGFKAGRDLITQIGWAVVRNGRLANCEGLLLNWSRRVDPRWLQGQLAWQASEMARRGVEQRITYERLCNEGHDPLEVLAGVTDVLREQLDAGWQIVGHNAWKFDRGFLDDAAGRFLARRIPWRPGSLLDTGLLQKASLKGWLPYPGEPLDHWQGRLDGTSAREKWGLKACAERYKLAERFGLDMSRQHEADFDCQLTWALLETYVQIAEGKDERQGGPANLPA